MRLVEMMLKARPRTQQGYHDLWRDNVRGLWRSFARREAIRPGRIIPTRGRIFTRANWVNTQQRNIRRYLTQAWNDGAAEFGITPNEFTDEERQQLREILETQTNADWLTDFYNDALARFRDGQEAESMYPRASLWSNRWNDIFNRAKVVFGKNQKLKWSINVVRQVETNCKTCLRLNNKVKRASQWEAAGILPQNAPNERLECGGWECGCGLVPTTEPMSKGPLPKTP